MFTGAIRLLRIGPSATLEINGYNRYIPQMVIRSGAQSLGG